MTDYPTAPFGIVWRWTDYCYSEIANFEECAHGSLPPWLEERYVHFLDLFSRKLIKKSTPVPLDLLAVFIDDLDNRAQIDYREWHDHDPEIVAGGKRFDTRYRQLRSIHSQALTDAGLKVSNYGGR